MKTRLTRLISFIFIISILVPMLPPRVHALTLTPTGSQDILYTSTNEELYKDIALINSGSAATNKFYKDKNRDELEDGTTSGNGLIDTLFPVIENNIQDKIDLQKLNNALRTSRLFEEYTGSSKITVDYSSTTSEKGILLMGMASKTEKNIRYTFDDDDFRMTSMSKSAYPKVANIVHAIYAFKPKEDNTFKFVLRTYIYGQQYRNNYWSAFQDEVTSINPEKNKIIFIRDHDITDLFIKIKESKLDSSGFPLVSSLMSNYSKLYQDLLDGARKDQKDIWDIYKSGVSLSSYFQKSLLHSLHDYITSDGAESAPTIPENITFSDRLTLYMYARAISTSGIYNPDLSFITNGTNFEGGVIDDNTATTATDWNLSNRKVEERTTAVSKANEIVGKYDNRSTNFTEYGVESNASLFNDLILYRYGKASGASERGPGSTAVDERRVNTMLDALLVDTSKLPNKIINPKLYDQRNNTTIFGFGVKVKEYMDILASAQLLETYASSNETFSGIENDGSSFKNPELEDEVENYKSLDKADWPIIQSGTLIKQIRAYKQIKEGLDYLGIKPWTGELQYIFDKYDVIKDIQLSEDFSEYDEASATEPLRRFFSMGDKTLSTNYMTGVALSATYIPMQTNLFDPTSVRVLKNESWLKDFHVRYGFYRKALMIDNNVNAAVDGYVTGSRDTSRIALLSDLLEYKKDIVLYVDDNFYNIEEAAKMTDKAYERLSNTEQAGMDDQSFGGWFDNLFNNSIEHILKTGPKNKYDGSTINDVSAYGKSKPLFDWASFKESMFTDGIIFSSGDGPNDDKNNEIKKGLDAKEYSIKQPYALVSGIYRDKVLVNYLNIQANKPKPVFISSPTLFNVQNVPQYEFNSIYNYYMLRNLESSMGIDYKTTLDIDNPVYVDIYGNITTESGLVVIPAASNATLYPKGTYTPYTLGFMNLYSKGDNIKYNDRWADNSPFKKYLIDFQPDTDSTVLLQKNYEFNEVAVNPQRPSVADSALLEVLYDNQVSLLNNQSYDFGQRAWLITEVMRGAPLENIDKVKEGIVGKRDVSKYGLYMSWKLDEIADMLLPTTNGNSIISMPNLAFMSGVEYVVLFAFKLMLILFVAYILYRIYIDAVGGRLGLRTLGNCISTIVVFVLCISAIPGVVSLSYNEPNKIFLQDEIKYINLLNYEKALEGREISAMGVTDPKTQTKLYLKLDSISIPWYKVLQDVMFAPVGSTLSELYKEELSNNSLYGYEDVNVVNNGVYLDIDDVFKSSSIIYNTNHHFLYQNINTSPTASYFTPYYYLIDNMLSSITLHNKSNNIINITTKIQSDGSVKTMGMIADYLLSEYFLMEANDPLGLYYLYGINTNEKTTFLTEEDDISNTKQSMWYVRDQYSAEDSASRIDQLYSHMRAYVAQNREMIGRVTDETFIKTMMLDVSMKYNKLFRIPAAKGIEVFSIDSRDLIRLSLTDKNTAVVNASNSFGKFVYEQSGAFGVILTAILMGVYFIASIVKPALVLFLCAILFYNVLLKRMISMDKGKTIEGLLYVLAILVIINSTYSLILKLSMSLPSLGLGVTVSIIGQIVIQAGYLWFVFILVSAIFKDFANFGYNVFHTGVLAITNAITGAAANVQGKAIYSKEQQEFMQSARMKNESRGDRSSKDLRAEMDARDRKRAEAQEDNAFMEDVFGRNRNNRNDTIE